MALDLLSLVGKTGTLGSLDSLFTGLSLPAAAEGIKSEMTDGDPQAPMDEFKGTLGQYVSLMGDVFSAGMGIASLGTAPGLVGAALAAKSALTNAADVLTYDPYTKDKTATAFDKAIGALGFEQVGYMQGAPVSIASPEMVQTLFGDSSFHGLGMDAQGNVSQDNINAIGAALFGSDYSAPEASQDEIDAIGSALFGSDYSGSDSYSDYSGVSSDYGYSSGSDW